MNRRTFFAALAALPVVGRLIANTPHKEKPLPEDIWFQTDNDEVVRLRYVRDFPTVPIHGGYYESPPYPEHYYSGPPYLKKLHILMYRKADDTKFNGTYYVVTSTWLPVICEWIDLPPRFDEAILADNGPTVADYLNGDLL